MKLLDLPNYLVAGHLPQLEDLSSFTRTCGSIHNLLTEYLHRKAALDVPDLEFFTPAFLFCVRNDRQASLTRRLEWTPRVTAEKHEEQPLAMGLEENHLGFARQLPEHRGTPSLESQANSSFFATAICKGNTDMLRLLLEFGCSVTYPNCLGKTPLQLAARTGHEDIILLLLEHGSDINYVGDSWAPLNAAVHAAVHRIHDPKVVELLVRAQMLIPRLCLPKTRHFTLLLTRPSIRGPFIWLSCSWETGLIYESSIVPARQR